MSSLKRSGSTDRFLGPRTAIGQASLLLLLFLTQRQDLSGIDNCEEKATAQIRLESPHPWRPPFGLERVGQPLTALAEVTTEERPYREYWIAAYAQGTEVDRQMFHL